MFGDEDPPMPENLDELPPAEVPPDADGFTAPPDADDIAPKEFLVTDSDSDGAVPSDGPGAYLEPAPGAEPGSEDPSVDDLLSAEILPEGAALPDLAALPAALPEHPTFQLRFRALSDEARPLLKKALDAQGAAVPEKAWEAAVPVISQLSEYQLVSLLQAARGLGVPAEVSVVHPDQPTPSEDDVALGALSATPDASATTAESAPSVALPKGEKEVLLCTPDHLPGGTVRETFGVVVAHRSIARRLFREEDLRDKLQKELRAVPGKPAATLPSSHFQVVLRELMLDLRKAALGKGANSVLGVKLEAFPESGASDPQLEQLRLVAFGTAAVVEKS